MPPPPFPEGRVAPALGAAARRSLRPRTVRAVAAGAAMLVTASLLPRVGPWVVLGLLAVAAWWYGKLVLDGGAMTRSAFEPDEPVHPAASAIDLDVPAAENGAKPAGLVRNPLGLRLTISALTAAAVVAPFLAWCGGLIVPTRGFPWYGLAFALVGGAVVPGLFVLFLGRDARGRLSPGQVVEGLMRHPGTTLAVFLIVPAAVLAAGGIVAACSWHDGGLPVSAAPRFALPLTADSTSPLYAAAFDLESRAYAAFRVLLSAVILWGLGLALAVQARCLGALAAVTSRRPPALCEASEEAPAPPRPELVEAAVDRWG
ncbi:MAG: hypothetical protein U0835_16340 [Isosphaeraceae bacterium]